jgi:hypothetical protein
MRHKDIGLGEVHIVYNYTYANAAARLAATGFVDADVGKLALQQSDNTLWLLIGGTPQWAPVSGEATTLDQLSDVMIVSPTDGQSLRYSASLGMWVNQ